MASEPTTRMSAPRWAVITLHLDRHGMLPEEYAQELLSHIAALEADLQAARATALEEAAKVCRDEVDRARRLQGLVGDRVPHADLVTAGREESATRILAAIRALKEG